MSFSKVTVVSVNSLFLAVISLVQDTRRSKEKMARSGDDGTRALRELYRLHGMN